MNSFGKGFTRVANLLSAHRKPKPSSLSIAGDWFLTRALHLVYWDYQLEPEHLSHLSISLWIQSWILVRVGKGRVCVLCTSTAGSPSPPFHPALPQKLTGSSTPFLSRSRAFSPSRDEKEMVAQVTPSPPAYHDTAVYICREKRNKQDNK